MNWVPEPVWTVTMQEDDEPGKGSQQEPRNNTDQVRGAWCQAGVQPVLPVRVHGLPQPRTMFLLLLDLLHGFNSPGLPGFPIGGHIRPRDMLHKHLCPQTSWEEVEDGGGRRRWRTEVEDGAWPQVFSDSL